MKGSRIAIILAVVSLTVVGAILLNEAFASTSSVTVNDNTVESDYFTLDIVDKEGNELTPPMAGTTYCTTNLMKIRTDWSNENIDAVDCCAVLDITYSPVWMIIDHIEFDVYVPAPQNYDGIKYVEDEHHNITRLVGEPEQGATVYMKETRNFGKTTTLQGVQSGMFSSYVEIPKGDSPFTVTIHFSNSDSLNKMMFNSLVNELANSKLTIMANENNPISSS